MQLTHNNLPIPAVNAEVIQSGNLTAAILAPFKAIARVLENRRAARQIRGLEAHLLKDIGLERNDIYQAFDTKWEHNVPYVLSRRRHENRICR